VRSRVCPADNGGRTFFIDKERGQKMLNVRTELKAKWYLAYSDSDMVFIIDEDSPDFATVTNAAERVVTALDEQVTLGNRRLYYRDSQGEIDELTHENGKFTGFRPGPTDEIKAKLSKFIFAGEIV